MAIILAGRFDTTLQVVAVRRDLNAAHFTRGEFASYYVNPPGRYGLFPLESDAAAEAAALTDKLAPAKARADAPRGALTASSVGGYVESLLNALNRPQDGVGSPDAHTEAGVGPMIAICVDRPGTEQIARATLHRHGAHAIERVEGRWENGDWKDYDARAAVPTLEGQY